MTEFSSSFEGVPRHVAIIMDGNGRWARARMRPRTEGHRQGVKAARTAVRVCAARGVQVLTLFAFSSENWRRPRHEVGTLMDLFVGSIGREVPELVEKGIRLRFIGDRSAFSERLQERMAEAETRTAGNDHMDLVVAVSYGGRWDITQAARRLAERVHAGELDPQAVTAQVLESHLATAQLPDPDLFIRTGGEKRISNFLLWQLAYTELYFSDVLWPDFDETELDRAFACFAGRQRRFGHIQEQIAGNGDA
ncbi:Undecaprenyl pyrophosphate synthetase [Ectothiorhodospira mobilis]|uniref:Ditrans,polycis-undecaprenyl-diphosphate synthase ((2E,6E)-farnesyl-diphosphate specific) n=1 Tax=Ectothiorhodospira mobilis TaxID=195064 RepID=A0A1I4RR89_ECTMO|nr:polyprenyl diphosphate synthase [Ectothiorhodospira mobilis]SFM54725.1 Undecaprenyl pyrophosphate synthetase [Ectothiorhodospira mobilis]